VEKMTGLGHDSGSGLVVGDYRPQRDITWAWLAL
jgi:hypothetical protein